MALLDASAECSGAALRRKQILEAARDAFRAHGFHAASMAVVAANARMSVGQIYRYFNNKEAIVAAIVGEHVEEFMRDLILLQSVDGPLWQRLLDNINQSIWGHIDSGFLSLTYEVRAEAARNPALQEILVMKDIQVQDRMMDLMRSTELARLSDEALRLRAEQVCLLFEGLLARIGRHPVFDPSMIKALVGPLLIAVFTLGETETAPANANQPLAAESSKREVDDETDRRSRHGENTSHRTRYSN
jgi:AcrR family transcriptional regulator